MAVGNQVGTVSIKVTPDTTLFRAELKAKLEALEDSLKVEVPVKLDLDENGIRAKVKAATSGLDETVNVKLDVDKKALDKFDKTVSGVGDGSNFLAVGRGASGGFGKLGPFVDSLALAAAAAAIAAPAIALVTGALATLPAVLAGVMTPVGVIALGMDGIKKAAEALSKPLAGLKESISGVFETRLTPVFDKLATMLPKLDGPLQAVAGGLSDVAQSFIDTITSGPGLEKIQSTIGNIAAAISTAAPGIGSLTNGLLGLAEGVSAKFPAVSQWFNKAADDFSKWVERVAGDGSLDRAMGNLGETLKGVLDIVGDIAAQGFEWLQDPKFAESMKTFVSDMKSLVSGVLPALGSFFEDLTGMINQASGAIDKLNKIPEWLRPDSQKDREHPKNKDGTSKDTSNFFEPFTSQDAPWRTMFDQPIANAKEQFGALIPFFTNLWATVKANATTQFSTLWSGIVTAASTAWSGLATTATTAFSGIGTAASNVVNQVRSTFSQIPGAIAGALAGVGGAVAGAFAAAVSAVASAGAQMISAIVSTGAQIVAEVGSWAGKVAGAAASLAGSLTGVGGQMIAGFLGGFRSAAAAAVSEVASWAGKIAAAARSALGIKSPSKVFTEIGSQTAQGLQNGLEGGFVGVIERAKALSQQLTDAVNGGLTGVDGKALTDGIKKQLDELELQRKQLKVEQDAIPKEDKEKRKGVQGQLDQIQAIKDQLALQKDQLGFAGKYGDELDTHQQSIGEANNMITESIASMIDGIKGFAMANVNQFQSDLGISGQGALPQIANMGVDWLSSQVGNLISSPFGQQGGTQINVNSVDEALAAKQTLDNKKALQFSGR